jgi:hypothetical protein
MYDSYVDKNLVLSAKKTIDLEFVVNVLLNNPNSTSYIPWIVRGLFDCLYDTDTASTPGATKLGLTHLLW